MRESRVERVLLDAADDADDGHPRRVVDVEAAEADALADRICARPELLRHVLVDDDDARLCRVSCSLNSRPATSGISIASK